MAALLTCLGSIRPATLGLPSAVSVNGSILLSFVGRFGSRLPLVGWIIPGDADNGKVEDVAGAGRMLLSSPTLAGLAAAFYVTLLLCIDFDIFAPSLPARFRQLCHHCAAAHVNVARFLHDFARFCTLIGAVTKLVLQLQSAVTERGAYERLDDADLYVGAPHYRGVGRWIAAGRWLFLPFFSSSSFFSSLVAFALGSTVRGPLLFLGANPRGLFLKLMRVGSPSPLSLSVSVFLCLSVSLSLVLSGSLSLYLCLPHSCSLPHMVASRRCWAGTAARCGRRIRTSS